VIIYLSDVGELKAHYSQIFYTCKIIIKKLDRSGSWKTFLRNLNKIKVQNICLGVGLMLLYKDELCKG